MKEVGMNDGQITTGGNIGKKGWKVMRDYNIIYAPYENAPRTSNFRLLVSGTVSTTSRKGGPLTLSG